jgi:shikimate kinase
MSEHSLIAPIPALKNLNIYLIGMMGCGKSTIGQLLAEQLKYKFFDTDHLIEQVSRQSVNDIFAMAGEEEFRSIEAKVLAEISAYTKLVVATGGGIVLRRSNWGYLQQGLVVWIDVPAEVLWERLASDATRPLLRTVNPQEQLTQLLASRRQRYAEADLHILVTAQQTPQSVAADILAKIPTVLKQPGSTPDPQ